MPAENWVKMTYFIEGSSMINETIYKANSNTLGKCLFEVNNNDDRITSRRCSSVIIVDIEQIFTHRPGKQYIFKVSCYGNIEPMREIVQLTHKLSLLYVRGTFNF